MAEVRVVVVGSRGMVGVTLLEVLAERGVRDVVACSQPADYSPSSGDVAFLAVSADASRAIVAEALACGARIVDCSAAFRDDPAVPLVVPEVNAHELRRDAATRLVASPNCSATMLVTGLEPLRAAFGLSHVFVATYQAVSGAGRAAVEELESETRRVLDGQSPSPRVFPQSCAFNVFPHESPIDAETSCNEEEQKLVAESRRMWGMPDLAIDASCARVPVRRAHCQAVTVTIARPATLVEIRAALAHAAGVELLPDDGAHVASAQVATGRDAVFVSRVRWAQSELDKPEPHRRRVSLWIACDQLRKGAATNAVQVAQQLGWLPA